MLGLELRFSARGLRHPESNDPFIGVTKDHQETQIVTLQFSSKIIFMVWQVNNFMVDGH